jgi:arylsulfatase A-like enzyme
LFIVDGLRLDLLEQKELPGYQRLKRRGVEFRNVHSPGSQTATTMASVFSGKYYSQLSWTRFGEGHLYHAYPVEDPSPRVPALLTRAGVRTVKLGGIGFLANRYGIAPGFSEERLVPEDDRLGPGNELVAQLLPLFENPSPEFVYVHFTDTHTPYRGPAGCAPRDCYEAAVTTVDSYLGQVLDAVERSPRILLLFTSDHGEAFGEHDSGGHSTTIYDILLRVPLIAYGGGLSPRAVNDPVSLIDLAPTLLELFGQPTPPSFMGESLVQEFRGDGPPLTRPIFAEGRLRRAVVDGDLKVIVDLRRKTVEAFDLARDPDERDNLYDREPGRFAAALGKMTSFYDANTAPGGPTYRP